MTTLLNTIPARRFRTSRRAHTFFVAQPYGAQRTWPATALPILLIILASSALAAPIRSSASYQVQFDNLASGSGSMQSASYTQPQTMIGANIIWAPYDNSAYIFQPTGVIMPPNTSNIARWELY